MKFACVTSAAAQLKFLASNKFNSLRNIFDIKIMTFPQRQKRVDRHCMREKLIKSRDQWKSKKFQITRDITFVSL